MYRLSASKLDSFRLYKEGDWMDLDTLKADLAGTREPTDAMFLGRAFHTAVEEGDRYLQIEPGGAPVYAVDGYEFDAQALDAAVACVREARPVWEVKADDYVIDTRHGPVRLVCKVDAISGLDVWEVKSREKSFDVSNYADALQWRAYVCAFGAASIRYRLCNVRQLKESGIWTIWGAQTLALYPYPAIRQDVADAVEELVGFMVAQGMEGIITERQAA